MLPAIVGKADAAIMPRMMCAGFAGSIHSA